MLNHKRVRYFLAGALILLLSLFTVSSTQAQSRSVRVLSRNADITIQQNGDVRFEEEWVVDFNGSFTFAFRSIPLNKVEAITDWGVREPGGSSYVQSSSNTPGTYVLESGAEEKITWYFSASNEVKTFILSYTLKGAVGIKETGDEFFWKFIESDRGYTIDSAEVSLRLPASFDSSQLLTQSFYNGTNAGPAQLLNGDTLIYRDGPFPNGSEWEVAVGFPTGYVDAEAPRWQTIEENQGLYGLLSMVATIVVGLIGGLGVYLTWFRFGRDKPKGVVPDFYPKPPQNLPPGVVGTLVDETADIQDILATVVDLARRGYLTIEEIKKTKIGRRGDFEFTSTGKDQSDLRPFEKEVMKALFKNRQSRKLSNMKNKFYKSLPRIKKLLYEEVTGYEFFAGNPEKVRGRYVGLGFASLVLFGAAAFCIFVLFAEYSPLVLCASGSLIIFPIGLMILSRWMPRKTERGARVAAQWNAFKRYLENIEKYTKIEGAADQFDKYLPYAIAFGLEKSWVRKFEKVPGTALPDWYGPYGYGFPRPYYGYGRDEVGRAGGGLGRPTPVDGGAGLPSLDSAAGGAFGGLESMSDGLFSMLDTASSNFTSVPASSGSGGYSGGGFSGGGGGGGGSSGFG